MRKILFATIAVCVMGFTACGSNATVGETAVDSTCQAVSDTSMSIADSTLTVTDSIN